MLGTLLGSRFWDTKRDYNEFGRERSLQFNMLMYCDEGAKETMEAHRKNDYA